MSLIQPRQHNLERLGTAANLEAFDRLRILPVRNFQATTLGPGRARRLAPEGLAAALGFLASILAFLGVYFRRFLAKLAHHWKPILGGVLGNSVIDAAGAAALADMPSREVQLAQLLGAIAAPMTSLASLITGPHRDLIGLLQARIDKEGEAQAA